MPEGHVVHRLARDHRELVGEPLTVTSPQGRFRQGAQLLDGRALVGVEAKGKHLFHHFGDAMHLHVHLGMQGKWLRDVSGRPPLRQARVRLAHGNGPLAWELVAPATCEVVDDDQLRIVLDHLGPDPLRADADDEEACRRLAADGRSIGEVLLDQAVISGVGNVLRAESLFACGVHPRRRGTSLSSEEVACLWRTLGTMMARAVEEGRILTVPDDDQTDRALLSEAEGRFVYKQERCRRCAAAVQVEEIGGRSSYACPVCQPESRG